MRKLKWPIFAFLMLGTLCLSAIVILGENGTRSNLLPANGGAISAEGDDDASPKIGQPDWQVRVDANIEYGLSRQAGFLFSDDGGKSWASRNNGLPKKRIYPFHEDSVRHLVSLGVDPENPSRVAVLTANQIYLSENYGQDWEPVARKRPIPEGAYLTAVALSPIDKNSILLGTSFAGIFETRDRGQNWAPVSRELKFLYQGADYWEEISAVAYPKDDPGRIIFRCGFGQAAYRMSQDRKSAEKINDPDPPLATALFEPVQNKTNADTPGVRIFKESSNLNSINGSVPDGPDALLENDKAPSAAMNMDPARMARLHTAAGRFGIYIRSDKAYGESLDQKIEFLKKNGLNAMVIDCKDDFGVITYDTKLTQPHQMGAVRRNPIKIKELLRKAKQNGIYVIARIVTFQDPKLFRYQNHKYAVWDKTRNMPWSTREYWVDPFSEDVWEYNRAIAEELQSLGVDEIQFDYIRFPTDGDISKIAFRYRPAGAEKADALESFLVYVRQKINIPISTDLYGFSCWCRSISFNGQNLDAIADYVDVICPMFYPSHFPAEFLPGLDYLERARRIYNDGTNRAYGIVGGRSLIRPYVQAFRLGKELKMTTPVYTDYLLRQIQGNLDSISPGFTLWDYSNSYYMVTEPVRDFLKEHRAGKDK
ncbi:MAG TPA: hypothetical protein DDW50_22865 [Firmicutes bacterium]|nr:hypothetical protein [Bacillota bacterium]